MALAVRANGGREGCWWLKPGCWHVRPALVGADCEPKELLLRALFRDRSCRYLCVGTPSRLAGGFCWLRRRANDNDECPWALPCCATVSAWILMRLFVGSCDAGRAQRAQESDTAAARCCLTSTLLWTTTSALLPRGPHCCLLTCVSCVELTTPRSNARAPILTSSRASRFDRIRSHRSSVHIGVENQSQCELRTRFRYRVYVRAQRTRNFEIPELNGVCARRKKGLQLGC
jgi:hypothetical protein